MQALRLEQYKSLEHILEKVIMIGNTYRVATSNIFFGMYYRWKFAQRNMIMTELRSKPLDKY